jgi:hypothetical protein
MKTKATPDGVQGEGNYKAAKQYGDSVKAFVKSGKLEKAIKAAKVTSPVEQQEMNSMERSTAPNSGKKKN